MSDFAFSLPIGDSATFVLTLTDTDGTAPNLTGWTLTFTAGAVSKTSGAGQVTVAAPGNIVSVAILAGDFAASGSFAASLIATSGTSQKSWYGTVVVTTAGGVGDLTTLQSVKDYLGMGDNSAADDILSRFITSSSAWVVGQLGRQILLRAVFETRDGNGTCRLLLRDFPVDSISAVTVDAEIIPRQTVSGGDGWTVSDGGVDLFGYVFTEGNSNVTIAYTAGYAVVPPDLEQATIEHVALRYRDRTRVGLGSQSLAGESVTYVEAGTLAYIQSVIDASEAKAWPVG